jgi:hypothetical protein
MNNSRLTMEEKLRIDREIEEMNKYPIDCSDIPERKGKSKAHLANKEFLDTLPPDILQELARRRIKQLRAAGYEIPESVDNAVNAFN